MVWDTEDAIRMRLELARDRDETGSQAKITVPNYKRRWQDYLQLVRRRKPEFLKELHARTCAWSKQEWTQVERGYERFYKWKSR